MSGQPLLDTPLSALSYPARMAGLGGGMGVYGAAGYGGAAVAGDQGSTYPSLAMDNASPFYGSLVNTNIHIYLPIIGSGASP